MNVIEGGDTILFIANMKYFSKSTKKSKLLLRYNGQNIQS